MAKTLTCITQEQICCIRYDLCEGQLSETYFYSIFRKFEVDWIFRHISSRWKHWFDIQYMFTICFSFSIWEIAEVNIFLRNVLQNFTFTRSQYLPV